jgi:hypothetical protein
MNHQCTICLDAVCLDREVASCPVMALFCHQHHFHADCLAQALDRQAACPVCRRDLTDEGYLLHLPGHGAAIMTHPAPPRLQLEYTHVTMQFTPIEELEDAAAWRAIQEDQHRVAAVRDPEPILVEDAPPTVAVDAVARRRQIEHMAAAQGVDEADESNSSPSALPWDATAAASDSVIWTADAVWPGAVSQHSATAEVMRPPAYGPAAVPRAGARSAQASPYSVGNLYIRSDAWAGRPEAARVPLVRPAPWRAPLPAPGGLRGPTPRAPAGWTAASLLRPLRHFDPLPMPLSRSMPRSLMAVPTLPVQAEPVLQQTAQRSQSFLSLSVPPGASGRERPFTSRLQGPSSGGDVTSSRSVAETVHSEQVQRWLNLINDLGESSGLYRSTLHSRHAGEHVRQAVARAQGSTLTRYLNLWDAWRDWAASVSVTCEDPGLQDVVDYLQELRQGASRDRSAHRQVSVASTVKALRFVARKAQLAGLQEVLAMDLVSEYCAGTGQAHDRREALPLPLAVVAAMEQRVLNPASSSAERILVGGLLVMIWASLRFGDGQRCKPSSLIVDGHALRGLCWTTKVSRAGQPFGIFLWGISCRPPQWSWAHVYVRELQAWAHRSASRSSSEEIDFLLPDMMLDPNLGWSTARLLLRPMPYVKAMSFLRWLLQAPWMQTARCNAQLARQYTLHSLKVTMLSVSRQLDLDEAARAEQGHHRSHPGRQSVRLYSRDDVFGAIRLQKQVVEALAGGFRPLRAQSRGSQAPVQEPEFVVPGRCRGTWRWCRSSRSTRCLSLHRPLRQRCKTSSLRWEKSRLWMRTHSQKWSRRRRRSQEQRWHPARHSTCT